MREKEIIKILLAFLFAAPQYAICDVVQEVQFLPFIDEEGSRDRVRIPLQIMAYKGDKSSEMKTHTLKKSMRVSLVETNHFYIEDYHVQTTPVKWSREGKKINLQLTLSLVISDKDEEQVGVMDIEGSLLESKEEDGIYNFSGAVTKTFSDAKSTPRFEVSIVSKAPKKKHSASEESKDNK